MGGDTHVALFLLVVSYNISPSLYLDGYGCRICDTFTVTSSSSYPVSESPLRTRRVLSYLSVFGRSTDETHTHTQGQILNQKEKIKKKVAQRRGGAMAEFAVHS